MFLRNLMLIVSAAALVSAQAPNQFASETLQSPTVAKPPEPKPVISPEMRGDIFMARKMYREAIDAYKQSDQTPILTNKIGIGYHQLTELGMAKRQYEKAIKAKPDYAEAINNLGTIYYAQKNYRRAVSYYRKALKVTPDSASVHSNLGTALFARKKYDEALVEYQEALRLDPEVFEHRGTHGVLLQERTVEERAKFHFYLAKTYARAGATERALLYLRKALEEGFKDRDKIAEQPEFSQIRDLPEFQQLLKAEQKVL